MTDDSKTPPPAHLSRTFARLADAMDAAEYAEKALRSAHDATVHALEEVTLAAETLGMPPTLRRRHWQPPDLLDPPGSDDAPRSG